MKLRQGEYPRRGDALLAVALLLPVILLLVHFLMRANDEGAWAEVYSAGERIGVYALSEEREITVSANGYQNIIHFGGGQVMVVAADCPDQYCVRHAPDSREGETIVCLPARLVVRVTAGEEGALDGIAR